MKKTAKILSLLLLVLLLASLFGCVKKTAPEPAEPTGGLDGPVYTLEPAQTSALTPEPDEPESTPAPTAAPTEEPTEVPTEEPTDTPCPVSEDGEYWTKDEVALYIHLYGHLPKNYITKEQAEALGWPGGSLEPYAPGCSIGGGYFGNYEGLLPKIHRMRHRHARQEAPRRKADRVQQRRTDLLHRRSLRIVYAAVRGGITWNSSSSTDDA